jgi:hypothetical protein
MASPRSCQWARVDDAACPWTGRLEPPRHIGTAGSGPTSSTVHRRTSHGDDGVPTPVLASGLARRPLRGATVVTRPCRSRPSAGMPLTAPPHVDLRRWTTGDDRGPHRPPWQCAATTGGGVSRDGGALSRCGLLCATRSPSRGQAGTIRRLRPWQLVPLPCPRRHARGQRPGRVTGRMGACGDNSATDCSFALLQRDVPDRQRRTTHGDLRSAISTWGISRGPSRTTSSTWRGASSPPGVTTTPVETWSRDRRSVGRQSVSDP